MPGSLLDNNEV